MHLLTIDDEVRGRIRKLIAYAKEHPTTLEELRAIFSGEMEAVGYKEEYRLVIAGHYKVVYSQEHQPDGNLYHHLSISVPKRGEGKYPSVPAFELIMEEFGMGSSLSDCARIWDDEGAINAVKKVEE